MKEIMAIVAATAVFGILGCSSTSNNGTSVGQGIYGVISHDTTWNSPAQIGGNLTINANVVWSGKITVTVAQNAIITVEGNGSLTVQEGVQVLFGAGSDIEVGYSSPGTLIAKGSDSLPIQFTRQAVGATWGSNSGGIVFYSNASPASSLDNCIIDSATSGIYDDGVALTVTHCKIRNNQNFGINFASPGAEPKDSASFIQDSITGNGSYGITMLAEAVRNLSGDTYFSGNGKTGIRIEGGGVTKNAVWRKHITPTPFVVTAEVDVGNSAGVTLTINPGTIFKLDQGAYFNVGYNSNPATFIANGTSVDSILFTTTIPGAFWGNTGNEPGGFVFTAYATKQSSLTYCVIDSSTGGLYVDNATLVISNNTIRDNQGSGVIFHGPQASPFDSAHFVNNTITGNGSYAIEIFASQLGNLSGTGTVAGNLKGGISVTGNAIMASATWKKYDAPYIIDTGSIDIDDPSGPVITIQPGAKFEFNPGTFIQVGRISGSTGAIIANGTPTDSIIFTKRDTLTTDSTSYWGDTGSEKGGLSFWPGATPATSLQYCVINGAVWGIYDDAPAAVTVKNCSITNCLAYGIAFDTLASQKNVSNNSYQGNGGASDTTGSF